MASAKFLNCEIVSLTCSLGFGGQESSVQLKLVECGAPYNGSLGCVYTISVGGFLFTGVLADHTYSQSSSGLIWDVRLTDGRQSLSNVSVILNDYYCNINTPNLINVLAILEPSVCNLGCGDFMASFKDDLGIPMLYILRALQGKTCLLPVCGVTMYIDVSQIISICPGYLKVPENKSDVLQLIGQACDEAGCDFIITIVGNTFTAVPINKKFPPPSGALGTFLNTIAASSCAGAGTIDYRYGEEASYEPSKKLVIGENVHYLMVVSKNGDCAGSPGTEGGGKGGTSNDAIDSSGSGSGSGSNNNVSPGGGD
jgi:hypothetical protein